MLRTLVTAFLFYILFVAVSQGHDAITHVNMSEADRQWYKSRMLTPEALKRLTRESPYGSWSPNCCDHADVVKTKFRVNKTSGGDEWWYDKDGKWELIPADIIHPAGPTPNNQNILFAYQGKLTCFFPAEGGI